MKKMKSQSFKNAQKRLKQKRALEKRKEREKQLIHKASNTKHKNKTLEDDKESHIRDKEDIHECKKNVDCDVEENSIEQHLESEVTIEDTEYDESKNENINSEIIEESIVDPFEDETEKEECIIVSSVKDVVTNVQKEHEEYTLYNQWLDSYVYMNWLNSHSVENELVEVSIPKETKNEIVLTSNVKLIEIPKLNFNKISKFNIDTDLTEIPRVKLPSVNLIEDINKVKRGIVVVNKSLVEEPSLVEPQVLVEASPLVEDNIVELPIVSKPIKSEMSEKDKIYEELQPLIDDDDFTVHIFDYDEEDRINNEERLIEEKQSVDKTGYFRRIFVDEEDMVEVASEIKDNILSKTTKILPIKDYRKNNVEKDLVEVNNVKETSNIINFSNFVKKKSRIAVAAIVFALMIPTTLGLAHYNPPRILNDNITLEHTETLTENLFDVATSLGFINNSEVEILNGINPNELGQQTITVLARDNFGRETIQDIIVEVVNTSAPRFILRNSVYSVDDVNDIYHIESFEDLEESSTDIALAMANERNQSIARAAVDNHMIDEEDIAILHPEYDSFNGVILVHVGESNNISDYVQLVGDFDGDLTNNIEQNVELNTDKLGEQTIILSGEDSSGNVAIHEFKFYIIDLIAPEINFINEELNEIRLEWNSEFNFDDWIIVTDNHDENPTFTYNQINTSQLGTQFLIIDALDESGNESVRAIPVIIQYTLAPVIELSQNEITVDINEYVDINSFIISATDEMDGNLIEEVNIISDLNTSIVGRHVIKFELENSSGIKITEELIVNVSTFFVNPAPGSRVTSTFGWRAWDNRHHAGIDLASGGRNVPIYAAREGVVTFSGWLGGYGNTIKICHGNGYVTLYAHQLENQVYVGQQVSRGQQIGLMGTTGFSTGIHLHFEIIRNGTPIDPAPFIF